MNPNILTIAAWIALGFIGLVGATILVYIWTNRINLNRVISEPNGDASLSRLQFLIFTIIIGASFFYVVSHLHQMPDVPQGVFVLLGISGSSYLVSKSIQFSQPAGVEERPVEVIITTDDQTVKPGTTIPFSAKVRNGPDQTVTWSARLGTIDAKGIYTAPPAPGMDVVTATSKFDSQASDTANVTIV